MKTNIHELKKGDTIRILKRPTHWDSALGELYPLNLRFPITTTINEIRGYSMGDEDGYGWDLRAISKVEWELVSEDCEIYELWN